MSVMRVANWNVEWRKPTSRDAAIIRERLAAFRPDVVCLTEAWTGFLSEWGGYEIVSPVRPDKEEGQRSVVLWSREPWGEVDDEGHPDLPRQSFVRGVTATPVGAVGFAGVIIPYHMADVAHGARNRKPWEQHGRYLDALPQALAALPDRSVVLGDFNQRIPSSWVPLELSMKLRTVFEGRDIVTRDLTGPDGGQAIDHIALSSSLSARESGTISNLRENGRVSDHFCVTATVSENNA